MVPTLIAKLEQAEGGSRETFIHYSGEPLTSAHDAEQGGRAEYGDKPNGLWFSVEGNDDGWKWWCEAESYNLDCFTHEAEITFKPTAKILHLKNAFELDEFHLAYRIIPEWAKGLSHPRYGIDWPRVAREYDAIIIAPYCWDRRLHDHVQWYYSWDCASGCVWNADAIAALKARLAEQEKG